MATATVQSPNRLLARISKGSGDEPIRVLLYGTEGIGKTTWASGAPAPVFLQIAGEGMPAALVDVPRIAVASYDDLLSILRDLREEAHDYQSLVIDSVTALELLIHNHMKARDNVESIETYGYGKGYTMALELLNQLLSQLELLQRERKMNLVLIGHAQVKAFNNPEGDNYDRYELSCNVKFGGLLMKWAEDVLFAKYDVILKKSSAKAKPKAIGEGRIVMTQKRPAYDAKNRHNLPEQLGLSWVEFERAHQAGSSPQQPANPETVAWIIASWGEADWPDGALEKTLDWLGVKDLTEEALMTVSEAQLRQLQDRMNQHIAKGE